MPAIKKFQVAFDCAEPERLARFWCEVLGYVAPPPPEGFATWDDNSRSQPLEQQGSWFARKRWKVPQHAGLSGIRQEFTRMHRSPLWRAPPLYSRHRQHGEIWGTLVILYMIES